MELIKREYLQATGGVINTSKVFYCLGVRISRHKTSYNTRRYLLAEN
jgi:hypothetical protein